MDHEKAAPGNNTGDHPPESNNTGKTALELQI
jgi:hypothetical protein